MKLSDFYYDLPESRIAQYPLPQRDASRLLAVQTSRGPASFAHLRFHDIETLLQSGDVLVVNQTKVFPARLRGRKQSGGKIEILILSRLADGRWRSLVRGATTVRTLEFPDGLTAEMSDRNTDGEWALRFSREDLFPYLEQHGEMPLPPYIKRHQRQAEDLSRYQTVFAQESGAVAAPTAGFHFTPDLLHRLTQKGVLTAHITLHVGWGTFRPVRAEHVENHVMLPERYRVTSQAADLLNAARSQGHRIVAVGTTCVRTLETVSEESGIVHPGEGESTLFIYPGYRFKAVDALVTNFHLPDSTPLLLANAFHQHRLKIQTEPFSLRAAYAAAIEKGYRFYSYGDAMVIL